MTPLLVGLAYLIGSIPFGYLIARSRGVDLFRAGSGNIGATNIGRVLGRKFGILVFLLDFAKGAVTVALFRSIFDPGLGWLVAIGMAAFLGHLFPLYLGFRGGKGVATGAGVVMALTPIPVLLGMVIWLAMASSSRIVSLASLVSAATMTLAHLMLTPQPWGGENACLSAFLVAASAMVFIKHRSNIGRLWQGNENRLSESTIMSNLSRSLHLIALATWFGGAVFFNFVSAPSIFATFKEVVANAPSDRTANLPLAPGITETQQAQLASALAGAAVGPLFPKYFMLVGICVAIALATAIGWWYAGAGRSIEKWRVLTLFAAAIVVAVSVPVSDYVTHLRLERLSPDSAIAEAAKAAFGPWHMVSLGLSFVLTGLALLALIQAARLPQSESPGSKPI